MSVKFVALLPENRELTTEKWVMIFGFNTDIKHENTVYHVQSEAREHDHLLQTQVFVRGRCIGKRATSYAEKVAEPSFSDDQMHDLLKTQHKGVIDAIRSGSIESLFPAAGEITQTHLPAHTGASVPQLEGGALELRWLNSDAVYAQDSMLMRFSVSREGAPLPGVQLISRLTIANDAPIYSQAVTNSEGVAEMKIFLEESALADAAVLVQATHEGRHATRKFRLRRTA